MKILILGGSGAIGMHLSQILSAHGDEVFVTSRKLEGIQNGIHYIKGNAHDFCFVKEISQDKWDAIVDLMVYSEIEFKNRYIQLQKMCDQYIFMSSSRVYADPNTPIKETSLRLKDISKDNSFLNSGEYAISKANEEDLLLSSPIKNYTIIRPYITFSESRLQLGVYEKEAWLYRALNGRSIVFPRDLYNKTTTLTYSHDFSTILAAVVCRKESIGQIYHITTNESKTWEEVINIYINEIESITGNRPKLILTKNDICEETYQYKYDRMYNRTFNNSKVLSIVPTYKFTSYENGIRKCLIDFMNSKRYLRISPATEAFHDKLSGERTPLSSFSSFLDKIKYLIKRYI